MRTKILVIILTAFFCAVAASAEESESVLWECGFEESEGYKTGDLTGQKMWHSHSEKLAIPQIIGGKGYNGSNGLVFQEGAYYLKHKFDESVSQIYFQFYFFTRKIFKNHMD